MRDELRWPVTASAISGCGPLGCLLTGTLAVSMRDDLRFDHGQLGLALAAGFGLGGLLGLPGGRLTDRLGWRRGACLSAGLSLAALLAIAVLARTPGHLVACLLLSGGAISIGIPSAALLISTRIPPERRGRAFGFNQSSVPVTTLLAGASVPALALTVGWRWSFVVGAAWPLATIALAITAPAEDRPPATTPRVRPRTWALAGDPALLLVSAGGSLGMLGVGSLNAFFVTSAVDSGLGDGFVGVLVAVASVGGIALRLGVGVAADRHGASDFGHVAGLLAVGAVGFAAVAIGVGATIVLGALLCYSAAWGYSGLLMFLVVREWNEAPGAATGFANQGLALAAALGPFAFGAMVEPLGYAASWGAVAAIDLSGGALLLLGRRLLAGRPASEAALDSERWVGVQSLTRDFSSESLTP